MAFIKKKKMLKCYKYLQAKSNIYNIELIHMFMNPLTKKKLT